VEAAAADLWPAERRVSPGYASSTEAIATAMTGHDQPEPVLALQ
jgi:hypothetical protein